jgi:hypothetical protein
MSRFSLLIVAGFALAACEAPTAPPQVAQRSGSSPSFSRANSSSTNGFVPFGGWIQNPCNGEYVSLSGNEHVMESITTGTNSSTYTIHVNLADVTGVGLTTGAQYHFNAAGKEYQVESGNTFSASELLNEEVISSGKAPNFISDITETFGYDGSNWYQNVSRMTSECRG